MQAAPVREVPLGAADVNIERRADGSILLRSPNPLAAYPAKLTERLVQANGGQPVDIVLDAIGGEGPHFFWTGNGLRKSAVADWQRALRKLFTLAGVTGNPHMFRHTFATDLLSKGIPIEDVSVLLGHKSIRITEAYYSHWVRARRERLEERVRELWT